MYAWYVETEEATKKQKEQDARSKGMTTSNGGRLFIGADPVQSHERIFHVHYYEMKIIDPITGSTLPKEYHPVKEDWKCEKCGAETTDQIKMMLMLQQSNL